MRISVILAHPDPESFNHAIAQTAVDAIKANRHRIFFHDLYQEKFDPRLNTRRNSQRRYLACRNKKTL